jgi:hypothetical protein
MYIPFESLPEESKFGYQSSRKFSEAEVADIGGRFYNKLGSTRNFIGETSFQINTIDS